MKTMIKKSVLLVALLFTVVANASSGKNGVTLKVVDAKLMQLSMDNHYGEFEITVKDDFGVVLHKEVLNEMNASKKYDFGAMPIGNYNLEIETKTKIESVEFKVTSKDIVIVKRSDICFKPVVHVVDDRVSISKLSLKGEKMEVSIYDNENHLIYYQKVNKGPNLGVRLSFEILGAGNYSASVYSAGRLFTEDFTIN